MKEGDMKKMDATYKSIAAHHRMLKKDHEKMMKMHEKAEKSYKYSKGTMGKKMTSATGKKKSLPVRKASRKAYAKAVLKSKPGEGKRFAALEKSISAGGAKDAGAIAASIGRKKYGTKKFAAMGAAGRKRKG